MGLMLTANLCQLAKVDIELPVSLANADFGPPAAKLGLLLLAGICFERNDLKCSLASQLTLSNSTKQVNALTVLSWANALSNAAVTLSNDLSLPELSAENSWEASS